MKSLDDTYSLDPFYDKRSLDPMERSGIPYMMQDGVGGGGPKKARQLAPEKIYDLLLGARTADKITLHLKDGRAVHGALIFHPRGTGRVINIDQELSLDFAIDDIRDLKIT